MRKVRIQLRHSGDTRWRFGIQRRFFTWGYNIRLGRFFIAIREPSRYAKQGLINLKFGRSMLPKNRGK